MKKQNLALKIITIFCFSIAVIHCGRQKPTQIDGTIGPVTFVVVDESQMPKSIENVEFSPIEGAKLRLYSKEYNFFCEFITDDNGQCTAENLLASTYQLSVDKFISAAKWLEQGGIANDILLTGGKEIILSTSQFPVVDTVKCERVLLSGLVINEIYYCGPPASGTYYFDQFIELYNASDSTLFLDGLIICRASPNPVRLGECAEAIYSYQFPGTGQEYPVLPGEFVVIAQDAIDHVEQGGAAGSLDLSGADWEFYTELEPDIDNPAVPNLHNINPNKSVDFLLNMVHNAVFLIKAKNAGEIQPIGDGHQLYEIEEVIDGIEYSGNSEIEKDVDVRIDAGTAGSGIARYTGKSVERCHPETGQPGYDTNNSTFDLVTLKSPTPGRQHVPSERD